MEQPGFIQSASSTIHIFAHGPATLQKAVGDVKGTTSMFYTIHEFALRLSFCILPINNFMLPSTSGLILLSSNKLGHRQIKV